MKKLLLTTICLAFATFSFSQQLSRYVVSSGGNYSTNGGYSNSSTIGETMVTTLTSASNVLTQGFQQSFSVNGCTDSTATNYDATATQDDGSCTYCVGTYANITVGGGSYLSEVSWTLSDGTGTAILSGGAPFSLDTCLADDCYTVDMVDSYGDGWNGSTFDLDGIALGGLLTGSAGSFTFSTGSASCAITGCTDSTASNYDATATVDDGSCIYPCLLDEVTLNLYDSWGDGWNGNSITVGGVDYTIAGSGSSLSFTALCVDLSICNTAIYNATGSYSYENSWDIVDASGAIIASGGDNSADFGNCIVIIDGCTDSTALNFDPLANNDDGSCVYCVYGCTDSTAINYDALATCDDYSCVTPVYGCTGPSYCNYDPLATMDDGSCAGMSGCTDPLYVEYSSIANCDDGSCLTLVITNTCSNPSPTNAYISELIHDRARVNWDNMNDANCMVNQYRIRYRAVGSSSWSSKTMSGSGLCVFGLNTASKKILGLTPSTTYEYYMKAWYCGGGVSGWSSIQNFTTADECQGVINFAVTSPTTTKATFTWDTTAAYSFARIKLRPDTTNAVWTTAGGFGVFYPLVSKSKNGLTPGQTYRASSRTWCDPTGGTYRSAGWTFPIFWTQPTSIRLEGGSAINNLDVYPNPSRDIFNVSFTSEDAQDLKVRVLNLIGEELINENLQQFIGEYSKQINLGDNAKGIYFLEIVKSDGIINKKLIVQ